MNNKITVYQYGNTIRFEVQFYDFDGAPINPQNVALRVYNQKYVEIHLGIGIPVSGATGKYFYDYETEKKEQRLIYEWSAEIDGKPSLRRDEFMTKFV